MLLSTPRARWTAALSFALVVHTIAAARACRRSAMPLHVFERGTPQPSTIHVELVQTRNDGSHVRDAVPFAPRTWFRATDVMSEPERPRPGLWLLHARPSSARRPSLTDEHVDAGVP